MRPGRYRSRYWPPPPKSRSTRRYRSRFRPC